MDASKLYAVYYGDDSKKFAVEENGSIGYKSLDELCDKFPHSYADLLKLAVPIIIDYLGTNSEDAVIKTLQNVDIIETQKGETNLEAKKRYGLKSESDDNSICIVDKKLANSAIGMYCSEPIIEEIDGEYQLVGAKNLIVLKQLDYSYPSVSTFVHEFLHAVKAQHNQYEIITGNGATPYLIERVGLIHRKSSITTNEIGEIDTTELSEVNVGIEEGINCYDENNVMDLLFRIPVESIPPNLRYIIENVSSRSDIRSGSDYNILASISSRLMENDEMRKYIRNAQLLSRYEECQSFFNKNAVREGVNSWQDLNSNIDKMAVFSYDMFNYIAKYKDDKEKMDELYQKLNDLALKIGTIISEFKKGIKNREKDELEK